MAFAYKRRSAEVVQQRAISGGNDFKGFLQNEYHMYTPKDGDNWVRILPPTWDDAEHYGIDVHVHYGVGPDKASVLCNAKMFNTACPICEAQSRAQKSGDEELARELRPNKRVLVWLLDRQEPSKGPLLWAMSYTQDRDICAISTDKMTGEYYAIDAPEDGFDLTFSKKGKGIQTEYSGYQIARKPSSVDRVHIDYVVNNPLQGTLVDRTYAEVKQLYEGALPESRPAAETAPAPAAAQARPRDAVDDDEIPFERLPAAETPAPAATGGRRPLPPTAAAEAPAALSPAAARAAALKAKFGNK